MSNRLRHGRQAPGQTKPRRLDRWVETFSLGLLALTMLYATLGLPGLDTADTSVTDHVNPLNSQIWLALLMLALPVLLLRWRAVLALARSSWPLLLLLAYFAASVGWALDPQASLRRLLFTLVQLVLLATLLSGIRRAPAVHLVIAAACAVAAFADLAAWIAAPGYAMAVDGFAGLQNQKNQAGLLMMYGCLASSSSVFLLGRRAWRVLMLCAVAVMAVLLIATRSTTSQSVVIAAVVVMPLLLAAAHLPRRSLAAIAAVLVLAPAAALLAYLAWCGLTGLDPLLPLRGVTVSERTGIWQFVIQQIGTRPWLGAGYGSFWSINPAVQPSLKSDQWFGIWTIINEAHEGYLDLLATGGVVGLAGGLFVLLRAIALAGRAIAATPPAERAWRDGVLAHPTAAFHLAFLLGLVVHNFTESNLFSNNALLAVALLLCLLDLEKWRMTRGAAIPQ